MSNDACNCSTNRASFDTCNCGGPVMTADHTPLWQYALGAGGFTVAFLALPVFWLAREKWQRYVAWNRQQAAQRNLQVHPGLHPNVTVLDQRSAR